MAVFWSICSEKTLNGKKADDEQSDMRTDWRFAQNLHSLPALSPFLFPEMDAAAAAYAGLGVILGHNFPCWHHFRGGKGVTCTCAAIVSVSFGYGLLACIVGLIGVLISHYLPVGAVLIPLAFLLPAFQFYGNEVGILTLMMALLMLQRHFSGLRNIRTGKEPRKDLPHSVSGTAK